MKVGFEETRDRIVSALENDNTVMTHAVWQGYIAALLEWNLIEIEEHRKLAELLARSEQLDKALLGIFLGHEGDV